MKEVKGAGFISFDGKLHITGDDLIESLYKCAEAGIIDIKNIKTKDIVSKTNNTQKQNFTTERIL